jgi:NAD-dependent SIR2 family protein deacetylase
MKTIAVFMGAGASKPFGCPLTNELLPLIKKRLSSGELFRKAFDKFQADREELSRCINVLLPGFNSVGSEDLPLITDVLSLVDHSLHSSNSLTPLMSTKALIRFRTLLERAILEVLDMGLLMHDSPHLPNRLSDWLIAQARIEGQKVGIISTNYDIELETQLFSRYPNHLISTEIDFGFSWWDTLTGAVYKRPANPSLRIYKLHGSLNWLRCDLCDHIYVNTRGSIAELGFAEEIHGGNTCHCSYAPLRSVIVAPSIVRDIRDANLLECWKNAIEFLRTATKWIIIGYSFPSEDIAIRSLFLRAYNARKTPPFVRVIQKGENKAVSSRYRLFFPNCIYETGGLEGFLYNEYSPADA